MGGFPNQPWRPGAEGGSTQQPLASSANRRATGRPPGVASVSTCFPDADPAMPPHDRPLHSRVRARGPNKKPKMSAMPPDKRFAYWDCAHALPRAPRRSPRFWLGPMLKFPLQIKGSQYHLFGLCVRILLRHRRAGGTPSADHLASAAPFSSRDWRLHFSAWIIQSDVFT